MNGWQAARRWLWRKLHGAPVPVLHVVVAADTSQAEAALKRLERALR
jgi:hypothetical protein